MANLRFTLLFFVLLDCSTAIAATRCPLPGGTCLPAHGHPVLETKINQLRDEFQRHADRSDAQVQKLQAEVAQQGERLSGLSAQIDSLAIELAKLKESAAKKDNRWLDLLLSGVVASIVSGLFIWLNRRSDLTTALVNQYQDLMNDRAGIAALFAPSASPNLFTLPANQNLLVKVGNWYEVLAAAYLHWRASRGTLWDLGLVEEAQKFKSNVANNANLASIRNQLAEGWPHLERLKDLPRPSWHKLWLR